MFISKKWQIIFLYIGRMDLGARHLAIILGTRGGTFANKNCPQGRAFDKFFQVPGVCTGACPGGCSRLQLIRTLRVCVVQFVI